MTSVSGNTTLDATYDVVLVTATATITLPTAVGISGKTYTIKSWASSITVTIATTSAQTIDGDTTVVFGQQYQAIGVVSNNTNWSIISRV